MCIKNVPKYINIDFSIFTLLHENNTALKQWEITALLGKLKSFTQACRISGMVKLLTLITALTILSREILKRRHMN